MLIRTFFISSVLTIALILYSSVPRAFVWFNLANLYRLHGDQASALFAYEHALRSGPTLPHVRWQTANALVHMGKNKRALGILKPLFDILPAQAYNLAFEALNNATQYNELISYYEAFSRRKINQANKLFDLSASAAASILIGYIKTGHTLPSIQTKTLLAAAFALDEHSGEFQVLADQLSQPQFWSTDLGQHVERTLEWRSLSFEPVFLPAIKPKNLEELTQRVANLLQMSSRQIELGDELIDNGDFERSYALMTPMGFDSSSMASGKPWNRAAFVMGTDPTNAYEGQYAIRIDGLWVEQLPEREPARAGFWLSKSVPVKAHTPYLLSFVYRTEEVASELGATFWLTDAPNIFIANDYALPPTQGAWKQVILIGWNYNDSSTTIRPLLRLWSKGTVWFDNLSIRSLSLKTSVQMNKTIIDINDAK